MNDIFISYEKGDRSKAEKLAKVLNEQGWSVWWDRTLLAGQKFDQVIQEEIENSKCIIVLWSKTSVDSDWVLSEADVGKEKGNLVPALIDDAVIPLAFRRFHTPKLTDMETGTSNPGLTNLINAISSVVESPEENDLPQPEAQPVHPELPKKRSSPPGQPETRIELIALIVGFTILIAVIVLIKLLDPVNPDLGPDQYLDWYIIGVAAVVILNWVALKFTDSDIQVLATKYVFILFGFLTTIAVIWRGISRSLDHCVEHQYLLYVYLVATGVAISVMTIFIYTRDHSRRENRLPIYKWFIYFCMYLITCRLAWALLDHIKCE